MPGDADATLQATAQLLVPALADDCIVCVVEADGQLRQIAEAAADPDDALVLRQLRRLKPAQTSAGRRVLESGQTDFHPTAITVPLAVDGKVMGTLSLGVGRSGRAFSGDEVPLVEELGRRAGQALAHARLVEQNAMLADRLARLQHLSSALTTAVTPDDVIRVVVDQGQEAFSAFGVAMIARGPSGALQALGWAGQPPSFLGPDGRLPAASDVPVAAAFRAGQPLFLESPEEVIAPVARGWGPEETQPNAAAVLPLLAQGRHLGSLVFSFRAARSFPPDERQFMAALADQCAQALQRALLFQSEHRAREAAEHAQLRASQLQAVTAAVARALTPVEVARVAVDRMVEALRAVSGWIGVVVDNDSILETIAYAGGQVPAGLAEHGRVPLAAAEPMTDAARTGALIWLGDAATSDACYPQLAARRKQLGAQAWCAIPMESQLRRKGAMCIVFAEPRALSPEEREFVLAMGRQVAQAFGRARLYSEAESARWMLAAAVQHLPAGVSIVDRAGAPLLQNEEARRLFGHTGDAAGGPFGDAALVAIRADGSRLAPADWPLARAISRGETVVGEEARIGPDGGSTSVVRMSAAPVPGPDGSIVAGIATFHDVTVERRAQDEQKFLSEASVLLSSSLDATAVQEQLANLVVPALADWCSIHQVDESGDVRLVTVRHTDPARTAAARRALGANPRRVDDDVLRVAQGGPPVLVRDLVGDRRARSSMIVPLTGRGRILGTMTFATARSGRRYGTADLELALDLARRASLAVENARLYAEAGQARSEAEEATRLKDEFLATLSHEMRTPLTAILGWVRLLELQGAIPDAMQHAVATIERNARLQLQMVEDLLDVSRIVAGKLRLVLHEIDLCGVVQAAVETVKPTAEAKGVRLEAFGLDAPRLVQGDADRLQQVFWNLLANAIKFTPAGGRVKIAVDNAGEDVRVRVEDTGRGIDPDFMRSLFGRFRQADGGLARKEGGLGLGLAICRHLVEVHGGTVEATSGGLGKGAEFTVLLHRRSLAQGTGPTGDAGKAREPENRVVPAEICATGLRVLVVEDDADGRELLGMMLEQYGATVELASSAAEGFAALERGGFDVLLSDVSMPGEDGYSFVQRVRASGTHPGIPAAALTAHARSEDRARALAAGFQVHVAKPVEPAALAQMVVELARQGRKRGP